MPPDAFSENIRGAQSLVNDDTNKASMLNDVEEGILGDYEDILELPMSDEELLSLRDEYENKSNRYYPKIKVRQDRNRLYLKGKQRNFTSQDDRVVPKNLLFEATATFVPASLAENPEPVVFSDNTDEGKSASNDLKTMLQYHADVLGLRQKLGVMVWQWGNYFIGCVKHGWEENIDPVTGEDKGDITTELRKPQNLVLDPDGYVDEFGDFHGWIGDRMEKTAQWFIDKYPKHEEYITLKVNGKLGTKLVATEWWTDEYCFTTLLDVVLDKHKNPFFNYPEKPTAEEEEVSFLPPAPVVNHFGRPKKPYTFLSVFSLQEEPYDFTNLIEQNISNQDRITDRDEQITKSLASATNSVIVSGQSFNIENADQAVQTFYEEGFLLVPDGNMDAVKRIPASPLPDGVLRAQYDDMEALRQVYGTSGLIPSSNPHEAVRNNILDTQHDASRIGGGVGDRLEITAKNIFNWWVQLYAVFYDEPRFGAVMGNARAVEFVQILSSNLERKFVVSVVPNSMKPKDEITERNLAMERWAAKAIDPISLMKALDDPDPLNSAKMLVLWSIDPMMYMQMFFPEAMPPPDPMALAQSAAMGSPTPTGEGSLPSVPEEGSQPVPDPSLASVPINNLSVPNI